MNEKLSQIVKVLEDSKMNKIVIYDLNMANPFFDYVVIATSTNKRQLKATVENIGKANIPYDHVEGEAESGWVLIDSTDTIINLMSGEARETYALDNIYFEYKKIYSNE